MKFQQVLYGQECRVIKRQRVYELEYLGGEWTTVCGLPYLEEVRSLIRRLVGFNEMKFRGLYRYKRHEHHLTLVALPFWKDPWENKFWKDAEAKYALEAKQALRE